MLDRRNSVIAIVAVAFCLGTYAVVRHHRDADRLGPLTAQTMDMTDV